MVLLPSLVPLEAGLFVISLLIGKFHASSTDGRGLVNFAEVEGVFGFELEGGGIFINVVFSKKEFNLALFYVSLAKG